MLERVFGFQFGGGGVGFRVKGLGIRVDQSSASLEEEDRIRLVEPVERDRGCGRNVERGGVAVRPRRERHPAFGFALQRPHVILLSTSSHLLSTLSHGFRV